jgi:acetate kinase
MAASSGVAHGDSLNIAIDSEGKDLEFRDVIIRVSDNYKLEMHIDTDEANAAELNNGDAGVLVSIHSRSASPDAKSE